MRVPAKNIRKLENARDRSLWRLNLDGRVVKPAVASPGYPSGEPAAFAAVPSSGCAGALLSACAYSPALRLDRWPTSRLGSAFSRLARPVASTRLSPHATHFLPTGCNLPTCVGVRPPARPAITPDSHRLSSFSSAGSPFGFRRLLQLPVCAFRRCNLQACARLSPPFAKPVVILRLASAVSPSGFTGFDPLACAWRFIPPAGPSIRP